MRRLLVLATVAVVAAVVVVIAASSGGSAAGPGATAAARSAGGAGRASVGLRRSALGSILVDGRGRTLYLFEADRPAMSACSGACASVWPPLTTTGAAHAGGGGPARRLGTIARADGRRQVTYGGRPLYRYAGDAGPGATTGQGLDQFGAEWYVLGRAGDAVEGR